MDSEQIRARLDGLLREVIDVADGAGLEFVAVHAAMARDAIQVPPRTVAAQPDLPR